MKKFGLLIVGCNLATGFAHAQSSVTLYGLLDAGIVYNTHSGDHSAVSLTSGNMQSNRWG